MKKSLLKLALIAGLSTAAMAHTLAVVNGENVDSKSVNLYVANLTKGRFTYDNLPAQFKKQLLNRYISDKVIPYQIANKTHIQKTSEYHKLLQIAKKDVAVAAWFEHEINSVKVSPSEVRDAYEKYKDQLFKREAKVKARHILVKTKHEAENIIKILESTPQTDLESKFIQLAKADSIGPSKVNGGELGFFAKNQMVKPFSEAAFALNPGEFTKQPVHTKFGWHVILVEEKTKAGYIPFAKVKNNLEKRLKVQKVAEEIQLAKDKSKIIYK